MNARMSRRRFVSSSVVATGLLVLPARMVFGYGQNEKINVGLVGVGGRGTWFVDTIPTMERVVALCDVDQRKIDEAFARWSDSAKRLAESSDSWARTQCAEFVRLGTERPPVFADFREMLDSMHDRLDAVIVATPDHTHAVITAAAMKAGKHVYCEKPLTRLVGESRALCELARQKKVATSMGNQGTAAGPFRRALELVRDGTLGEIQEVHVWNDAGGADRHEPPQGEQPIPAYLQWDLWQGPAASRPFHPDWLQRNAWRDFGTCQLGNWGSHSANLAFMALKVNELWSARSAAQKPVAIRVEAKCSGINHLSFPRWETITWDVPARASLAPIRFTWYNGGEGAANVCRPLMQDAVGLPERERKGLQWSGALLVGTQGRIVLTGHNATFCLLPDEKYRDVARDRPQTVSASPGHEADWFAACRGSGPAWANFDYASALNEFLMLGNVATQCTGPLDYDPLAMRITNDPAADALLHYSYRDGWTL